MYKLAIIPSVFVFVILGCGRPEAVQLAGTWRIKETSKRILSAELNSTQSEIALNANGSFTAHSLPGLFENPPRRLQPDGGSGVWKLVRREGEYQVQLDFQMDGGPFSFPLKVSRGWSKTTLFYFLGDPDEGLRVDFEKN